MNIAPSKYRILEKIGAGGMGEVYKAEDLALLRKVAIKVMTKKITSTANADLRFLREARLASSLNHPHIVTIYEIGETDEHAFIVMEYIEGRSLRELIRSRPLTAEEVLRISLQISDALIEAHAHGIIHRDIKPENILLTERGDAKLLDFGLAKNFLDLAPDSGSPAKESLTDSGAVIGTVSYMSPEQLRRESLDGRSDIFSFGIVLYEMLTGSIPFPGANTFDIAAAILKDQPQAFALLPPNMPAEIKLLNRRLLVKKRDGRPASFVEIKRELETLIEIKRRLESIVQTKEVRFESQTLTLEVAAWKDTQEKDAQDTLPLRLGVKSPPTVLVLPLEAVGASDESSFIGIGLAHAITTKLAKISGISVLSKTAGAARIEAGRNTQEAARELGATILLEGEIMRAGNTLAVMARLTNVENGRVIWGEQYRGDVSEVFSIQDTVCESIVLALQVNLSSEARTSLARPATQNLEAFEFYSKGRACLERHDVKENVDSAIEMFEQALALDDDFALAYAGLGEAYWEKYRGTQESHWIERAITASDHALVLDPTQSQVYVSLGIVYHGTGKIDNAIEQFERAIDLQPLSDEAHKWLGRCYQRRGEKEKAVAYFEKAISIRPAYWHHYNLLGECYYIFGCYREAAEQFRRVIAFQPDNSKGYDNLGSMYYLLGFYEDAVKMHKKATEIYADPLAYTNLGSDYFYLGRFEEAIGAYQAAIALAPRNDILYRNLGDAYTKLGRAEEAKKQYQQAIELLQERLRINAKDGLALGDLAICYAKLNADSQALEAMQKAIALEPHNTQIMYLQAVVLALAGQSEEAIEQLKNTLEQGYSRAEAARDPDLDSLRSFGSYQSLFPGP